MTYDDAIKVLEEILKNQQLIEDEKEQLDIQNYESSKFMSQILNRDPFHPQSIDPPREKKESGMWRRQLIDYLNKDGLSYNEQRGKLQWEVRTNAGSPIEIPTVPELKEYYHVRVRIDRGSGTPDDLHEFNMDEKSLLEEVVRKYNEEGIDSFYLNGRKVDPSDRYALTIYRTWLGEENITIRTKFDKLWAQVEKKGKNVTPEYIKIPSNPWKDKSQICLGGHIINSSYTIHQERNKKTYCADCGKSTITECRNCQYPLQGDMYKPYFQSIGIHPSSYCDNCGSKFPWVKESTQILGEDELSRTNSAQSWVESLLSRFHSVVKTLENRDRGKEPLKIHDEYDVQYLLMALLRMRFSNIMREEWTPSYAGSSKRMDFIVKDEKIVIETKMTRTNLGDKEIGDQLLVDIGHYKRVPACKNLFCFIYDPSSKLVNPQGLRDLESDNSEKFAVHVIISPEIY